MNILGRQINYFCITYTNRFALVITWLMSTNISLVASNVFLCVLQTYHTEVAQMTKALIENAATMLQSSGIKSRKSHTMMIIHDGRT